MIVFIFFIVLILRFMFLSNWLEDWDSVQFALALRDFDIVKHQPHPPGYPLYVAIGKFFNFFLHNDLLSLTFMNALFGSLTVIPLYLLVIKMFDRKTAFLACILFVVTPIVWMSSEVALTNIVGLFFLTVFAYFMYRWQHQPKKIVWIAMFGGFILGFRFTEVSIIASLLLLYSLREKKLKQTLYIFLALLGGILLWMVPIIVDVGLQNFITEYSWIANYVLKHDALLGQSSVSFSIFKERLATLWHLLQISYTPYFIILSLLSSIWLISQKQQQVKSQYLFIFVWILAYLLPLLLFFNLEVTRYTLPLSVPIAIICSVAIINFAKRTLITLPIAVILILLMFAQGLSQVTRFKNATPPTVAPVLYVKENFSPNEVIILASFTYRQFQYYAPEYQSFYVDKITSFEPDKKTVIIDHQGITKRFPALANYETIENREFKGDGDIFSRVSKINLFVLTSKK